MAEFPDGLYWNKPSDKAPDFVRGNISIHAERFRNWLDTQPVNEKGNLVHVIDLKKSKAGKLYFSVNDFVPSSQEEKTEVEEDSVPF